MKDANSKHQTKNAETMVHSILGGKALEWRLEDENDKRRKLIEARCLGYALKILSFIVSSPREHVQQLVFFLFIMYDWPFWVN